MTDPRAFLGGTLRKFWAFGGPVPGFGFQRRGEAKRRLLGDGSLIGVGPINEVRVRVRVRCPG